VKPVARTLISFHYMLPEEMRMLHTMLVVLNARRRVTVEDFEDWILMDKSQIPAPLLEAKPSDSYIVPQRAPLRKLLLEHVTFFGRWDVSKVKMVAS